MEKMDLGFSLEEIPEVTPVIRDTRYEFDLDDYAVLWFSPETKEFLGIYMNPEDGEEYEIQIDEEGDTLVGAYLLTKGELDDIKNIIKEFL